MGSSAAAAGLAFALTLTGGGRHMTSDRFTLRAPGLPGSVTLALENPDLYGSTFAAPLRVKNETDGDLLAVSVEVVSLTETKVDAEKKETQKELPGGEGPFPAWDFVKKGETSSAQLLKAGPVAEDSTLVLVFGRVHGVAFLGGLVFDEVTTPDALDTDAAGAVWVRDRSGAVFKTDTEGRRLSKMKSMPVRKEKASGACLALGAKATVCKEAPDGTLVSAKETTITVTDPDGRSRSFRSAGDGPVVALAYGKDGRFLAATAGDSGRKGAVLIYRPF